MVTTTRWFLIEYNTPNPLQFRDNDPANFKHRQGPEKGVETLRIWILPRDISKQERSNIDMLLQNAEGFWGVIIIYPRTARRWIRTTLQKVANRKLEALHLDDSFVDLEVDAEIERFRDLLSRDTCDVGQEFNLFSAEREESAMATIIAVRLEMDEMQALIFDVEEGGKLSLREDRPAPRGLGGVLTPPGDQQLLDAVIVYLNRVRKEQKLSDEEVSAVAISSPGVIDSEKGVMRRSGRFGIFEPIPVAEIITENIGWPTYLYHDTPSMALGEMRHGVGKGLDPHQFVFVLVGEGIGSAIFTKASKGQFVQWLGEGGTAGEIGRMVIDPNGPYSEATQNRGALEVYTSRYWINSNLIARFKSEAAKTAGKPPSEEVKTHFRRMLPSVSDPLEITPEDLAEAIEEGDPLVIEAIDTAAQYMAMGVTMIVDFYAPGVIILGGSMMDKIERYFDQIYREVYSMSFAPAWEKTKLLRATLGVDAQFWGSAELAMQRITVT